MNSGTNKESRMAMISGIKAPVSMVNGVMARRAVKMMRRSASLFWAREWILVGRSLNLGENGVGLGDGDERDKRSAM